MVRSRLRRRVKKEKEKGDEKKEKMRMGMTMSEWKRWDSKRSYQFYKVLFEKRFVSVRLREFDIKRLRLRADQLIRHFTPSEIRRAATKLMRKKQKFNF